jgi:hypothetical protein
MCLNFTPNTRARTRETGADWGRGGSGQTRPAPLRPGQYQSPPVPRLLPVTGPGGGETTPRAWALKTAPARAYERDCRRLGSRGLGADPSRPPEPRAAPVFASPSPFARDRPRGGRYYTPGIGPENGASARVCEGLAGTGGEGAPDSVL